MTSILETSANIRIDNYKMSDDEARVLLQLRTSNRTFLGPKNRLLGMAYHERSLTLLRTQLTPEEILLTVSQDLDTHPPRMATPKTNLYQGSILLDPILLQDFSPRPDLANEIVEPEIISRLLFSFGFCSFNGRYNSAYLLASWLTTYDFVPTLDFAEINILSSLSEVQLKAVASKYLPSDVQNYESYLWLLTTGTFPPYNIMRDGASLENTSNYLNLLPFNRQNIIDLYTEGLEDYPQYPAVDILMDEDSYGDLEPFQSLAVLDILNNGAIFSTLSYLEYLDTNPGDYNSVAEKIDSFGGKDRLKDSLLSNYYRVFNPNRERLYNLEGVTDITYLTDNEIRRILRAEGIENYGSRKQIMIAYQEMLDR